MAARTGKVIVPGGADTWPHELETAKALARAGHTVEFMPRAEGIRAKSADIHMDGNAWEIKCPQSRKIEAIERNIRRACNQSKNVVLDARHMAGPRPNEIEREARKCLERVRDLRRLILVLPPERVLVIK